MKGVGGRRIAGPCKWRGLGFIQWDYVALRRGHVSSCLAARNFSKMGITHGLRALCLSLRRLRQELEKQGPRGGYCCGVATMPPAVALQGRSDQAWEVPFLETKRLRLSYCGYCGLAGALELCISIYRTEPHG